MEKQQHGIYACWFDNLAYQVDGNMCCLECLCGFIASGSSWESAGCFLDMHHADVKSVLNTQKDN